MKYGLIMGLVSGDGGPTIEAIQAEWRTGELVDFLFLIRLTRVGMGYLNKRLIPALCKKAVVPFADVRGNIPVTAPAPPLLHSFITRGNR